jgi:hypothetical protein
VDNNSEWHNHVKHEFSQFMRSSKYYSCKINSMLSDCPLVFVDVYEIASPRSVSPSVTEVLISRGFARPLGDNRVAAEWCFATCDAPVSAYGDVMQGLQWFDVLEQQKPLLFLEDVGGNGGDSNSVSSSSCREFVVNHASMEVNQESAERAMGSCLKYDLCADRKSKSALDYGTLQLQKSEHNYSKRDSCHGVKQSESLKNHDTLPVKELTHQLFKNTARFPFGKDERSVNGRPLTKELAETVLNNQESKTIATRKWLESNPVQVRYDDYDSARHCRGQRIRSAIDTSSPEDTLNFTGTKSDAVFRPQYQKRRVASDNMSDDHEPVRDCDVFGKSYSKKLPDAQVTEHEIQRIFSRSG